jgi:site-specific recombinase XerD
MRPQSETVKYLSDNELRAFFTGIERNPKRRIRVRDICLFNFILSYGLREGEVGKILVGDLDFQAGQILVRRLKRKNFSSHYVLSTKNLKLVRAWMREREKLKAAKFNKFLFITQQSGADEALSPEQIYYSFKKYVKEAGIGWSYPHVLRHTTAIQLLRKGFNPMDIKRRLGHSSLSSTEIYLEIAGKDRLEKDKAMDEALGTF